MRVIWTHHSTPTAVTRLQLARNRWFMIGEELVWQNHAYRWFVYLETGCLRSRDCTRSKLQQERKRADRERARAQREGRRGEHDYIEASAALTSLQSRSSAGGTRAPPARSGTIARCTTRSA